MLRMFNTVNAGSERIFNTVNDSYALLGGQEPGLWTVLNSGVPGTCRNIINC